MRQHGYNPRKARGGELGSSDYTAQLATCDCTGGAVCVEMCPDDALGMEPEQKPQDFFNECWEHSLNFVSIKDQLMDKYSVKGSQFQDPLMEFSDMCSGCGETPHVKLDRRCLGRPRTGPWRQPLGSWRGRGLSERPW